jgi:60 kDa SS-A/Ro ribonucleoprotein
MANKSLFSSIKSWLPRATATNEAGGAAYALAPKHALSQIAATGCFNGTFYATGESQLDELKKLIDQVDDNVFLAKLAVFAWPRWCLS